MNGQLPEIPDLPAELMTLVAQIPSGTVTTYGDLAAALGDRSAARWVGEFLRHHPHPASCACHRVVRHTGEPGLYVTGDESEKSRRLEDEGVHLRSGRVDLNQHRFTAFTGSPPLAPLLEFQHRLPDRTRLQPFEGLPELVGGVDLAYRNPQTAVASCAVIDSATGKLVWSHTITAPVPFPYISGLLTYRELPPLLALLEEVAAAGQLPPLLLVDGNGTLHPRRAGIAVATGVVSNHPTIGIGKSLLCGQVDLSRVTPTEPQPVLLEGEPVGLAMQAKAGSKPVFISPGHRTDLATAGTIVSQLFHGHRVPEPIYHADRLCRQTARHG